MPRGRPYGSNTTQEPATVSPGVYDIVWAAGFYEGEGHCSANGQVIIAQKDPETLHWMKDHFGGAIALRRTDKSRVTVDGIATYYQWWLSGPRAIGFLMTIYRLLSSRRQYQIDGTLACWKNPEVLRQIRETSHNR